MFFLSVFHRISNVWNIREQYNKYYKTALTLYSTEMDFCFEIRRGFQHVII